LNPLRKADDATELATTGMGIEEVTEYIMNEVNNKWQ
jgi:cytidylate kinase